MKLKNWTDEKRGRQADLARIVGVSLPTMTRWVNELDEIPESRSRQIERATGGAVTMEEMLPDKVAEFEYMRNRPIGEIVIRNLDGTAQGWADAIEAIEATDPILKAA